MLQWVCSVCHSKQSVRHGSFFQDNKLPIPSIIKMFYIWSVHPDTAVANVKAETGVSDDNTVMDYYNEFRDVCQRW